jgi:aminopeptidase N
MQFTHLSETQLANAKLKLRTRLTAAYADRTPPPESQGYIAGANPEEMMESPFFRSRGFFPASLLETNGGRVPNHLHYGGGLNLRGYAGYEAEFPDGGIAYRGPRGVGGNVELEFHRLIPLSWPKVAKWVRPTLYAFYDAGAFGRPRPRPGWDPTEFDKLRQDAGLGTTLTLRHPDLNRNWREITLRADFPFFLSNPPYGQPLVQFRWLVGVSRAF